MVCPARNPSPLPVWGHLTKEIFQLIYASRAAAKQKGNVVEIAFKATPELVRDYFRLFVNRRAYTLQSMRPHPESGRHYFIQTP